MGTRDEHDDLATRVIADVLKCANMTMDDPRSHAICSVVHGALCAEREACAKIAEEIEREHNGIDIAAAIRARKTTL